MNIAKLLQYGKDELRQVTKTPELETEVLLAYVLDKPRSYLIAHKEKRIAQAKSQQFRQLVSERRKGTPMAYLVQQKDFYGLPFFVDKRVLIPRPETEVLVELVLEETVKRLRVDRTYIGYRPFQIIDVGCGSGNIAVSLLTQIQKQKLNERFSFEVYLSDISGGALQVAKKNYKRLITQLKNVKVNFVKADLLKGFKTEFDIIVSNAPYIPRRKIEFLDPSIRNFEPHVAIDGGVGGMEIITRLITDAQTKLSVYGALFMEVYEDHPTKISLLLKDQFPHLRSEFFKDQFGDWRFVKISKLKSKNQKVKTEK